LTKWQAADAGPTASGGNPDPTTGGGSEEAGDRQLGHALQVCSVLISPWPPPAKAGEITMTTIAAPKSSPFMGLCLCPQLREFKVTVVTLGCNTAAELFVDPFAFTLPVCE